MCRKIFFLLSLCLMTYTFSSCDEPEGGESSSNSSAKVEITSVVKSGNKINNKYTYKVTVKATGVSSADVSLIGVGWGPTSSASSKLSTESGVKSTTRSLSLSSNSTVYLKPRLKVKGQSTIYGTVKKVKVP